MSKVCGTCRHRGKDIEYWDYEQEDMLKTGYFVCNYVEFAGLDGDLPKVDHPLKKAYCIDGSGYYGAFCVDYEFGCNQWEEE